MRESERYLLLTAECLLFFFTVVHKQIISYSLFTLVLLLLFNFDRCSFHVSSLHIFKKKVEEEREQNCCCCCLLSLTLQSRKVLFLIFTSFLEAVREQKQFKSDAERELQEWEDWEDHTRRCDQAAAANEMPYKAQRREIRFLYIKFSSFLFFYFFRLMFIVNKLCV